MQIVTIRLSFNVVDFRISTFHKCGFLFAIEMEGDLSIGFFFVLGNRKDWSDWRRKKINFFHLDIVGKEVSINTTVESNEGF